MVFFDYQEGRSREGPVKMLRGFRGYIQSDGYNAYEVFDNRKDITLLHCLAHARRMFIEAMDNDRSVADYVLVEIQRLYTIERRCRDCGLTHDQIHTVRQTESVPILSSLGIWMKQRYIHVPPKSSTGKALAYSIGRGEKLSRYTENGMLQIDNNGVENSLRPVAIGKKNYLFAGSHDAAYRNGMLYSLLGTCKMHGINPHTWLKDMLQRIASHPINKIHLLLPHHWVTSYHHKL